jgi:3-oxoacyl-[acyl-carrier protein] reductase
MSTADIAPTDLVGAVVLFASVPPAFNSALEPKGIRVNAVAPGIVATDMSSFTKTESEREIALGMQALKRIATPNDTAKWVTEDTVHVEGGSKL